MNILITGGASELCAAITEKLAVDPAKNNPLKRLLTLEEVAAEVSALLNDSQHINGTNRIINAAEHVI